MNAIFASKIPEGNTGLSEGGDSQALQSMSLARALGTIPGTVNPPQPNLAVQQEEPVVATTSSTTVARAPSTTPPASTRVASANASDKSEGFFSSFCAQGRIGGTADAGQPAAKLNHQPRSPPRRATPGAPRHGRNPWFASHRRQSRSRPPGRR